MAAVASSSIMTTEEMLALPEAGIDRELIRGELRERPMTKRNRWHSRATIRLGYLWRSGWSVSPSRVARSSAARPGSGCVVVPT
jgi:hypothetical protein